MQFVNEMPGKADNCSATVTADYALKKKVAIIVGYYCIFFRQNALGIYYSWAGLSEQ